MEVVKMDIECKIRCESDSENKDVINHVYC